MAVKWTAEQQKVIDTRDRNLLVSAAAGSGKTAVLVERKNLLQVYSSTCTEQFTEQFADQEMTGYWWSLTNIQLEEER